MKQLSKTIHRGITLDDVRRICEGDDSFLDEDEDGRLREAIIGEDHEAVTVIDDQSMTTEDQDYRGYGPRFQSVRARIVDIKCIDGVQRVGMLHHVGMDFFLLDSDITTSADWCGVSEELGICYEEYPHCVDLELGPLFEDNDEPSSDSAEDRLARLIAKIDSLQIEGKRPTGHPLFTVACA